MKKILLSLMVLGASIFGKAQVLNEIMAIPPNCNNNGGGAEYFELFSNSGSTNLDCYALVVYYQKTTGTGQAATTEKGFYVIDFPSVNVIANADNLWWFVVSSQTSFCLSSQNSGTAQLDWDPYVKKYVYDAVNDTYFAGVDVDVTDLFVETGGGQNGTTFSHNAMLFSYQSGTTAKLVNGIFSNMQQPANFPLNDLLGTGTPPDITGALTCGGTPYPITFSGLGAFSVEYTTANAGSGNGYYRTGDGVCGSWQKASAPTEHTPGSGAPGAISTNSYSITGVPICPMTPGGDYTGTATFVFPVGDNPYPIEYYIIKDANNDGSIDPAPTDTYTGPFLVPENIGDPLPAGNTITITFPDSDEGDRFFIRARSTQGCFFATHTYVMISCTPLPVKFKAFTANRTNSSSVAITWTTASEDNSKGFNIQRNVGGVWQTIAYVPSQAVNGTSTSDLTYSYTDANSLKGITQYRIQQVDLDGQSKYSDIRAIRGDGTASKIIVYPNPSVDGKVNVVFEDNTTVRDVFVNDMQGKVIKSFRGITNNILVIDKLPSGFYTIRITNRNTAASSVEKVVVK